MPPEEAVSMSAQARSVLLQRSHDMFYHGFDNYMEHAFPMDELKPVQCTGEVFELTGRVGVYERGC